MSIPYPDFVNGTTADADQVDANNSDLVAELTNSLAADGQTTPTANLPMGGYKHTGLGAGSAATDSATLGQIQAEGYIWCGTMGGTADAGTLSPSPAITAYAAGQRFAWKASSNANTGAMTIAISGLSTLAAQNGRAALSAGDHSADDIYMGILDTTSTIQIMKIKTGGDGDVSGPASSTDNSLARFDGTSGKLLKDGAVIGVDVQAYDADTTKNDVANAFTATQSWAKGADVASASALTLGADGNYFDITGTTSITSITTIGVGTVVKLQFDGALTLTHHATDLILPGAANITTAAGDEAEFIEYATGDWRCTNYQVAATAPGGGGAGAPEYITTITGSGATVAIDNTSITGYDDYLFKIRQFKTTAASNNGRVKLSGDNGSTFKTMYGDMNTRYSDGSSVVNTGNAGTTDTQFIQNLGTTDLLSAHGYLYLRNGDGSFPSSFESLNNVMAAASDNRKSFSGATATTAGAVNHLTFSDSGGGTITVEILVYGINRT